MKKILIFIWIIVCSYANTQVLVGEGSTLGESVLLDVESGGSKALLLPRVADSLAIVSPQEGMIIHALDTQSLLFREKDKTNPSITGWYTHYFFLEGNSILETSVSEGVLTSNYTTTRRSGCSGTSNFVTIPGFTVTKTIKEGSIVDINVSFMLEKPSTNFRVIVTQPDGTTRTLLDTLYSNYIESRLGTVKYINANQKFTSTMEGTYTFEVKYADCYSTIIGSNIYKVGSKMEVFETILNIN